MNDNEALVAMKIYQRRHGGNLAEISILFANVVSALKEAAQQSMHLTCFPQCKGCEYNPCDLANNSDYCPARR